MKIIIDDRLFHKYSQDILLSNKIKIKEPCIITNKKSYKLYKYNQKLPFDKLINVVSFYKTYNRQFSGIFTNQLVISNKFSAIVIKNKNYFEEIGTDLSCRNILSQTKIPIEMGNWEETQSFLLKNYKMEKDDQSSPLLISLKSIPLVFPFFFDRSLNRSIICRRTILGFCNLNYCYTISLFNSNVFGIISSKDLKLSENLLSIPYNKNCIGVLWDKPIASRNTPINTDEFKKWSKYNQFGIDIYRNLASKLSVVYLGKFKNSYFFYFDKNEIIDKEKYLCYKKLLTN